MSAPAARRAPLLAAALTLAASASAEPLPPPQLAAQSYVLLAVGAERPLVEHNADMQLPPASLTKIMTGYILAEYLGNGLLKEDEEHEVGRNAWAQNPRFVGSSLMFLEPGRRVTLGELHRGLVISSGNDASVAIAEHISGSEAGFVDLMNKTARQLGLNDTVFRNAHGLSDPTPAHTSARDVAVLTAALIERHPQAYSLYAEREFTYNNIKQRNRNTLLGRMVGVDGVKTGYTAEAGYGLVASAEREGLRMIAVIMGAISERERFRGARLLMDYGFIHYERATVARAGQPLLAARIWGGRQPTLALGVRDDVRLVLPRGRVGAVARHFDLDEPIEAPVALGATLGELELRLDSERLAVVDLQALEAVAQAVWWKRLWARLWRRVLGLWR